MFKQFTVTWLPICFFSRIVLVGSKWLFDKQVKALLQKVFKPVVKFWDLVAFILINTCWHNNFLPLIQFEVGLLLKVARNVALSKSSREIIVGRMAATSLITSIQEGILLYLQSSVTLSCWYSTSADKCEDFFCITKKLI